MLDDLRDSKKGGAELLDKLEAALKQDDFLAVAEEFHRRSRPDQFVAFLREQLDPDDVGESSVHRKALAVGFRGILTTNFDCVFEKQGGGLTPLIYPQCLEAVDQFREPGFFAKIHGCVRASSDPYRNLILTDGSYKQLRQDRRYHAVLQALFTMHTLLTVGFSLADPDFLGVLDDLREVFGDTAPTVYALMMDPGQQARDKWRVRGVEIIPYDSHSAVEDVLDELLDFGDQGARSIEGDRSAPRIAAELVKATPREFQSQLESKLTGLKANERVNLLLRIRALLGHKRGLVILPLLVTMDAEEARNLAAAIVREACESGSLDDLPVDAAHVPVRELVVDRLFEIAQPTPGPLFWWLFRDAWGECGIDVAESALAVARSLIEEQQSRVIEELVRAVEGDSIALQALERLAGEVSQARPQAMGEHSEADDRARLRFVHEVRLKRLAAAWYARMEAGGTDYQALVSDHLGRLGEDPPRDYVEGLVNLLLGEFVHRAHLTLHGSSLLYDPHLASQVVEALEGIEKSDTQRVVLHTILGWFDRHRGLVSRGIDFDSLIRGMFIPLWWRYSSEARLPILQYSRSGMGRIDEGNALAGQEFLLDLMGLSYDPDEDFRRVFRANLDTYRVDGPDRKPCGHRYEPRILQEIWRDRELTYRLDDGVPPELLRRAASRRVDWERSTDSVARWEETRALLQERIERGEISDLVSPDRCDIVINGLLSTYDGARQEVVLYPRVIKLVGAALDVRVRGLDSIAFAHATARAFLHLGRDKCNRRWEGAGVSSCDPRPDRVAPEALEGLAQYYTNQLAVAVGGDSMRSAFKAVEAHGASEVRAWRKREGYSLEQMRTVVVQLRELEGTWSD